MPDTPTTPPPPVDPATLSPAMRQYRQFKDQHPGYVLFFRMGDFYEMFWDDARVCSRVLGVALTSRNKASPDEIPMAGVPFHAVEGYLRKMMVAGHRVALCEQMEDPSSAKGVVRREVVRLMTPGTLTGGCAAAAGSGDGGHDGPAGLGRRWHCADHSTQSPKQERGVKPCRRRPSPARVVVRQRGRSRS